EVAGVRGGRRGVRTVDPDPRRHRLHLGAPAAPLLQAGAVDRALRRLARAAARARRGRHPHERGRMDGLMMDFSLTLPALLRRAETFFGNAVIATRLPDKSFHHYTYADMTSRAPQLAVALQRAGLERGDRVATLCWNHYQHLEAYLGIPAFGGVTHTLNLRLHPNDIGYIAKHGGDKLLIVDESLLPLAQSFLGETDIEQVIVIGEAPEG